MISKAKEQPKSKKRPTQAENLIRKTASAPIVVKSIPDAKRSDRFYTSIRLPRELWDRSGFGAERSSPARLERKDPDALSVWPREA